MQWFPLLKSGEKGPSLLASHPHPTHIVRWERPHGSGPSHNFGAFDSYVAIYKHLASVTNPFEKSFHEVCPGTAPQKPRFDIDIDRKELGDEADALMVAFPEAYPGLAPHLKLGEIVKDILIEAVLKVFERDKVTPISVRDNFIICSSHGPDKASFHVIIHGWYHPNSKEAKAFYKEVVKLCSHPIDRWLDHSIYSSNHCLRMLGCYKLTDIRRVKKLEETFFYKGERVTYQLDMPYRNQRMRESLMLARTLVTFITGCEMLPLYAEPEHGFDPDLKLSDPVLAQISDMLERAELGPNGPFRIGETTGNMIWLERLYPSFCQKCDREHEKMYARIYVKGDDVLFNCGRPPGMASYTKIGEIAGVHGLALDQIMRYGTVQAPDDEDEIEIGIDWSLPTLKDFGRRTPSPALPKVSKVTKVKTSATPTKWKLSSSGVAKAKMSPKPKPVPLHCGVEAIASGYFTAQTRGFLRNSVPAPHFPPPSLRQSTGNVPPQVTPPCKEDREYIPEWKIRGGLV